MNYELYDDICYELTNFENSTDPETSAEYCGSFKNTEWADVFYDLLCRVQSAIDMGELCLSEEYQKKHPFGINTTICGEDGCDGCIFKFANDIDICKREAKNNKFINE